MAATSAHVDKSEASYFALLDTRQNVEAKRESLVMGIDIAERHLAIINAEIQLLDAKIERLRAHLERRDAKRRCR